MDEIYIVFSKTPLYLGKIIRLLCGGPYNHVSLSLNRDLKYLYSCARYYKSIPFYGGAVTESCKRYRNKNRSAPISVCAVTVPEDKKRELETKLAENSSRRIIRYNMLSALAAPFHKRVNIPNYYTCVEYVCAMVSDIVPEIENGKFYDINELENMLSGYNIYRGDYPISEDALMLDYERKFSLAKKISITLVADADVLKSYFNRKRERKE